MSKDLNAPKISVIIPVYMVEPYLCRCVDSVLAQTYKNLEIILVDDGSPDNCGAICDEYARRDARIKVIHKENGGLSDARNAGLDVCTGEYIAFVDSDDWIEPNMYEKLLSYAEEHDAQIAVGGVSDELLTDSGVTVVKTTMHNAVCVEVLANTEAMRRYFHGSWAAWDKIYRREIFEDVRYPVGEINEDEAIVLCVLEKSSRVVYTNEVFYHYIRRPESITTNAFSVKKLAWKNHCAANLAFVQKRYPELELDAAARYRGSLLWSLTEIALTEGDFKAETKQMRRELWENRKLFWKVPYTFSQDKLRLAVLLYLPFCVYRVLILNKRRNFTDET